ncbi:phosphoribosylamine--glycine ligase [Sandaracinobacteroides saxicola]|uniref:Phosphoribosylamine--glycine ligase n=1 Tax=Sandaracinobacteroides saxicola TaxID=2759707 RepID=A0A7G5IJS5_9SPHN|nr:phosphoribosylamine--glycine ligase [Sandaracinobacteroides saxicola]QMW23617.1 phosphoribosylamine--glycine ligase [Sandaracinobacteroides saxicola]
MTLPILLLGSGGREHALAWKLRQSTRCGQLFCAPGNPGIAPLATCVPLDPCDPAAVTAFALEHHIALVVIGPEAPLVAGVADALRAANIPVFGPSRAAAQLEASKGFTKALCDEADIPTARYRAFTALAPALEHLATQPIPIVVKADGLAAGKGVTVATSHAEASAALHTIFAESGAAAVIEECLIGEEASFFVLTDGTTALPFGSAQDHKRVGEGDSGPNTGGMGAYSPAAVLTPELEARVMAEIIHPTIATMAARGTPYQGVLFAGLMLTPVPPPEFADTEIIPTLIEYNCRFGDPETQVLMPRFAGDFVETLLAVATGTLHTITPAWHDQSALTVVMAAEHYPATPAKGDVIHGADGADALIFHAGTARRDDGALVTAGGRVLAITGTGNSVTAAAASAYAAVEKISWRGEHHRRDIGWRAIERERT